MEALSLEFYSRSPEDSLQLGERIGRLLAAGDVVLLQGPLGAGKTALTKGLATGAGSGDLVTSPTFVLINEYRGRVKLYHVDLYRLEDEGEIVALDLPGYSADGALVVEWPERGEGLLPAEHLHVLIEHSGETERRFKLSAHGARAASLLGDLAPSLSPAGMLHD